MSHAIVVDWVRCPAGAAVYSHVEDILEWPEEALGLGILMAGEKQKVGERAEKRLGHLSDAREAMTVELVALTDPLVLKFINAKGDKALAAFASAYGLPVEKK